jgi:uncharacterized protein YyaL (SSP411 family)
VFGLELLAGWVLDRLTDAARAALGKGAERKAFKRALERALYAFNARHPSWQAALLDMTFLQQGAAPVLAGFINGRGALPDPSAVVAAWTQQFSWTLDAATLEAAEAAVTDLIEEFERQLAVEPALQQFLDRLALDRTAERSQRIASEIAALQDGATQDRIAAAIGNLSDACLSYQAAAEAHAESAAQSHVGYRLRARSHYEDARRALILMKHPGAAYLIARFRDLVVDPYGEVIDAVDAGADPSAAVGALEDGVEAFQAVLDGELFRPTP